MRMWVVTALVAAAMTASSGCTMIGLSIGAAIDHQPARPPTYAVTSGPPGVPAPPPPPRKRDTSRWSATATGFVVGLSLDLLCIAGIAYVASNFPPIWSDQPD